VFCEKPLTTSFSQTSELYKLAKQNNVLLFEGIKTGFSPIYVKVKSLLKEKVLGKICYVIASHAKVSTSQKVPNPPSNAKIAGFHRAGALYELFQVLDICGKVKTLTFMNNHYQHNTSAISTSVLNMRHQNGIISTAFGSDEFSDDLSTKICGTKGVIILGGNIKKYHQDYHKDSSHFAYSYR
jgi:predicted dehydrogenase